MICRFIQPKIIRSVRFFDPNFDFVHSLNIYSISFLSNHLRPGECEFASAPVAQSDTPLFNQPISSDLRGRPSVEFGSAAGICKSNFTLSSRSAGQSSMK